MPEVSHSLVIAGIAFAGTLVSIPAMMLLAPRVNLVDRPAHRKIHTKPVPYLGGLAILLGVMASLVVLFSETLTPSENAKALYIILPSISAFLLGLADDRLNLKPRIKLLGQILIVATFVAMGYRFTVLTLPGLGQYNLYNLSYPLTAVWMLAVLNATNFIDGVDGLASSALIILLIVVALMAAYLQDFITGTLALATLGATLAFLIFNWRPAKIYLGDSGSLGIGMLAATCLVSLGQDLPFASATGRMKSPNEPFLYQLPMLSAVAAYPLLEISLTILRRLLQGKPLGSADKGHLHHQLLNRGWRADRICYAVAVFGLMAGGAVVFTLIQYRGIAAWFLVGAGLASGIGLHFSGLMDVLRPWQALSARPHFLLAHHFISMQRIKLDFVENVEELNPLLAQTCLELGVHEFKLTVAPGKLQHSQCAVFAWKRPSETESELQSPLGHIPIVLFQDNARLEHSVTAAAWAFDARGTEEDLDVEFRVLMSDFMRTVLPKAEALYQKLTQDQLDIALTTQRPISSDSLRRRRASQRPPPLRGLAAGHFTLPLSPRHTKEP